MVWLFSDMQNQHEANASLETDLDADKSFSSVHIYEIKVVDSLLFEFLVFL